jgi:hypothetical protein
MSATPRKRRLAVKMSPVAMGQNQTHAPQQTKSYSLTSVGKREQLCLKL